VPRLIGAKDRTLFAKPDGGFADHKHLALDGGYGLGIFAERLEIQALGEAFDHADGVKYIAQRIDRITKRQARPRALLLP
jgi:hypothetical protein